jgi:hypothetical protein
MLETAGKKLGISPDTLRAALSDPKKAESLVNQIDKKTGGKISSSDPSALKKMIDNNPKAKKMFDDFTRGGRNG